LEGLSVEDTVSKLREMEVRLRLLEERVADLERRCKLLEQQLLELETMMGREPVEIEMS